MEYLKIRKWDIWQTFRKDRTTPQWIKLHRCLMRNVEWVSLTDAERGQLVTIWLLAADRNGTIPADPEMVQRLCFMADPPNISKFIELEFLESERLPSGNQEVTTPQPVCPPREEKRREEKIYVCEFFSVEKKKHEKYKIAYPLVDILSEYTKMAAWLESNPSKRKTQRGYPKFVNSWLSRKSEKIKPTPKTQSLNIETGEFTDD